MVVGCSVGEATDEMTDDAMEEAFDAPEAAGAALLLGEDELDPVSPPMPSTALQVPVKDPELSVILYLVVTSGAGPGFGIWTSFPSTVVHPLAKFATKRSGRLEKATAGALLVLEPALIWTLAQLM